MRDILEWMQRHDVRPTLENFIAVCYGDEPPPLAEVIEVHGSDALALLIDEEGVL
jgi:hypothetical protein